jgi:hypothetical protein
MIKTVILNQEELAVLADGLAIFKEQAERRNRCMTGEGFRLDRLDDLARKVKGIRPGDTVHVINDELAKPFYSIDADPVSASRPAAVVDDLPF